MEDSNRGSSIQIEDLEFMFQIHDKFVPRVEYIIQLYKSRNLVSKDYEIDKIYPVYGGIEITFVFKIYNGFVPTQRLFFEFELFTDDDAFDLFIKGITPISVKVPKKKALKKIKQKRLI